VDVIALNSVTSPLVPPPSAKPAAPTNADVKTSASQAAASGNGSTAVVMADAVHAAVQAKVDAAPQNSNGGSGQSDSGVPSDESSSGAAKSDPSGVAVPTAAAPATPTTVATTTGSATEHAAPVATQLASQIVAKAQGPSSRFDISLDPAGLGHVNVSIEINSAGQVTAAMTFDNAHAAAEAKNGAGALQHALEQAGFNVAQGGLSFDVGGQGAGFARQDARSQSAAANTTTPIELPADLPPPPTRAYGASYAASGVDITI